MRYSHISVILTVLFVCLLSCGEAIGEKHDSHPKKTPSPEIQRKNPHERIKKDTLTAPTEIEQNNKVKEKKKRASDTLKPKIAALK